MSWLRRGWCDVRNPFRPSQVRRVSLSVVDVQCIFFWTRFPGPLLPHLDEIEKLGHRFVFHVTVTDYPRVLEPHPIPLVKRLAAVRELARRIGPSRVWWRYDPIILGEQLGVAWHINTFCQLADQLAGSTTRVTLSLLDWYRKTERRLRPLEAVCGRFFRLDGSDPLALETAAALARAASERGIKPVACCEEGFAAAGISPGACIDGRAVADLFGIEPVTAIDPGQRPQCRCAPSYDIGAVDTCLSGCAYCYATSEHPRGNFS